MVWYSYLLKNFPQFVMMHTVKGFGVFNKADVVLEHGIDFRLFISSLIYFISFIVLLT